MKKEYNRDFSPKVYQAKLWRTKILLEEAEETLDVMIQALLPTSYRIEIETCDHPVEGFSHMRHYTHCGKFTPDGDEPHWMAYAHSPQGAKAKLLGLMFEGMPVSPLT